MVLVSKWRSVFSCVVAILILNSIVPVLTTAVTGQDKNRQHREKRLLNQKMDWLKHYGTVVWVGPEFERRIVRGCRARDNSIRYYKDWGVAKGFTNQEVINCPAFFYPKKLK